MSDLEKLADPWQGFRSEIIKDNKNQACPIWGEKFNSSCFSSYIGNRKLKFWSPKAGGAFIVHQDLLDDCLLSDVDRNRPKLAQKLVFSRYVYEQNRLGIIPEILEQEKFDKITSSQKLNIEEKMYRLLESLAELSVRPANGIWSNGTAKKYAFDGLYLTMANCELEDINDLKWLSGGAIENEHLESIGERLRLTPKGLSELSATKREIQSQQAFVAMWFGDSMKGFRGAIREAIKDAGYHAYLVDEDNADTNEQVTNKILAEIKNSKCLIADFTHGRNGARGGVYFEAGFALGQDIPVIWLIRDDDISEMHFDTAHFPHIKWKTADDLKEQLTNALLANQRIGPGPLRRQNQHSH